MFEFIRVVVLLILLSSSAYAQLQADYNHIVDGDTANFDIWLTHSLIQRGNVRLAGIDTPELRGKCVQEKWLAQSAKAYLNKALSEANTIQVDIVEWADKYGRPVMRVSVDGQDIASQMIDEGLGRPYDGGRRAGWCD